MADDTRDRVLNAAGPIFAQKGFDGATVREICAAADVNIASVNYHFGSKETLYLESVTLAHQQKLQHVPLPELAEHASREEKLHGFIRTILSRLLGGGDGGWQTELLIREMIHPTHACKPLVEDYIRPQFHLLLEIIGEFVPPDTSAVVRQHLAFSVVGQCLHYRVARGFVSLLVSRSTQAALVDIETLAEHITQFSIAALSQLDASTSRDDRRKRRRPTAPPMTATLSQQTGSPTNPI